VVKKDVTVFRQTFLNNPYNDLHIGSWFDWVMKVLIPIEAGAILFWWLYQYAGHGAAMWDPFAPVNLGTCLFQWGLLMLILATINNKMYRWVTRGTNE